MELSETADKLCEFCLLKSSRYTCPRCNVAYCSLECYKCTKHAGCSEAFYKDSFMTELKQRNVSDDEKREVLEMLKRLEEEDEASDDEEVCDDLEGLNIDEMSSEQLWSLLSDEEKNNFPAFVQESASSVVERWKPWWEDDEKITEIDKSEASKIPTEIKNEEFQLEIKDKKPASQLIKYNFANLVFTYALLMRFYNGEAEEFCSEICENLLKCSFLADKISKPFQSLKEALKQSWINFANLNENFSNELEIIAMNDSAKVAVGKSIKMPSYASNALSKIKQLLANSNDKSLKKKIFIATKKIDFLENYVKISTEELIALHFEFCILINSV